jgi:hemoglobin
MTAVTLRALAALLLTLHLTVADMACADPQPSLYDRLGGQPGVAAIADSLIDRVASDPQLGRSFQDADLGRIKRLLAEQICDLSGGPCRYSGDSMKETHAGHHISEAEFYGMVADLREILKQRHVSLSARNELLRLLAPMKRDVVEAPQPAASVSRGAAHTPATDMTATGSASEIPAAQPTLP